MSMPKYRRKTTSTASIVVSSENLIKYLFRITNNEKQFSKALRYTLNTDIRNTCLKLEKAIYYALSINPRYYEQYKERVKYQKKAYKRLVELKCLIVLAASIANISNMEYLSELYFTASNDFNRWVKNDRKKYSKLPSHELYLANMSYKNAPKFTCSWNEIDPMDLDMEGFVILRYKNTEAED